MNTLMRCNIFIVAASLAVLMPLITANVQHDTETQSGHHEIASEINNLKNINSKNFDGSAELSGENGSVDLEKRYRLMGKRMSEDDDELVSEMEKRYRLMGKRYRLMGKRYRLMGKRGDESADENDLSGEDDEGEAMEKRYRLMGKRYRLMGRNYEPESVKRYRIYGK